MQYHLNGFRPGDPLALPAPQHADTPASDVDVLIIGCGSAGLTLATQLAAFPDITTRIVEQKPGPLQLGQADGIACRNMEMFEAFGFSERVLRESYWVNETTFWKPGDGRSIVRGGRVKDTEDGLSEFPHVILNQARLHDFFLDTMRCAPARLEPDYARSFDSLELPATPADPVVVRLKRSDSEIETVRARYVVGCDGARSGVRRALGLALDGESANKAWGVMDVLAVTDFPDIRLKTVIQSPENGSVVIIPREGGYLVRLYIEMEKLGRTERAADRNITIDQLIAAAAKIFRPYTLAVHEVAWWSVYEIGQRLCPRFDDVPAGDTRDPRVFIAGDACHTHSPKAGQGMNVSMQDGFNLGWKLAAVLRGRCAPHLLRSYHAERHAIAAELIAFDREWNATLGASTADADQARRYFVQHGRFTAGVATHYAPSTLTAGTETQDLAEGYPVGMRFHSAPVIRLADARPLELGHCVQADGRWRIFLFANSSDPADPEGKLHAACASLTDGPVGLYTPHREDLDAAIDVRAVLQQEHRTVEFGAMPALLRPAKGRFGLIDYEKIFCADPGVADIFDLRGIDRDAGCIVIVRPDQYVAAVLPLDQPALVSSFFAKFMIRQRTCADQLVDVIA